MKPESQKYTENQGIRIVLWNCLMIVLWGFPKEFNCLIIVLWKFPSEGSTFSSWAGKLERQRLIHRFTWASTRRAGQKDLGLHQNPALSLAGTAKLFVFVPFRTLSRKMGENKSPTMNYIRRVFQISTRSLQFALFLYHSGGFSEYWRKTWQPCPVCVAGKQRMQNAVQTDARGTHHGDTFHRGAEHWLSQCMPSRGQANRRANQHHRCEAC